MGDVMPNSYGSMLDSVDIIATLDSLPARFYIKDCEGRFVYMNPACARGMGLSSVSDGVGSSDADFFEESFARIWLGEEKQLVTGARSAIRDREEREVRKDGSQRWVLTTKVPIYGNRGTVIGIFGVSSDISGGKARD